MFTDYEWQKDPLDPSNTRWFFGKRIRGIVRDYVAVVDGSRGYAWDWGVRNGPIITNGISDNLYRAIEQCEKELGMTNESTELRG